MVAKVKKRRVTLHLRYSIVTWWLPNIKFTFNALVYSHQCNCNYLKIEFGFGFLRVEGAMGFTIYSTVENNILLKININFFKNCKKRDKK